MALLLGGLVGAGFLVRTLPVDLSGHALAQSPGVFLLLGAAACAVGVPRQAIAFAGGYAYGFWGGGGLALVAQALGCLLDLLWSRAVARDWARRRLRGRFGARLARLDAFLASHPFGTTLTLRLLPVGNNLALNLLAGLSAVATGPFLAASIIGYLPQTIIFALLGEGVEVGRAVQIALGAVLFAASSLLGILLLRRQRAADLAEAASGAPDAPLSSGADRPRDDASPPPRPGWRRRPAPNAACPPAPAARNPETG